MRFDRLSGDKLSFIRFRSLILQISSVFFIFPKFESEKLLIWKIVYLSDYNYKSLDLAFIGFVFSSDFRGYQIRRIGSSFDPSI